MDFWSKKDDEMLVFLQSKYGNQWKFISTLIPSRTESSIRNRWTRIKQYIKGTKLDRKNRNVTKLTHKFNKCLKCGRKRRGHICGSNIIDNEENFNHLDYPIVINNNENNKPIFDFLNKDPTLPPLSICSDLINSW